MHSLVHIAGAVAGWLAFFATVYVAGYFLVMLAMVLVAAFELRKQRRVPAVETLEAAIRSGQLPPITVIVPAFNEELSIIRSVRSILATRYTDLEVVVVNDGSRDATLQRLVEAFDLVPANRPARGALPTAPVRAYLRSRLEPRVLVVDKKNGGKADALNAGINVSSRDLVCIVDADVLLDEYSFARLAWAFIEDPTTVAAGGTIRLLTGKETKEGRIVPALSPRLLSQFQALEYTRSFSVGRLAFNPLNAHLIISGAFGLFRRQVLLDAGGYHPYAIGEDMELVVRIHSFLRAKGAPYRITSVPDAVLYTEPPHTLSELGRQRTRWHQGLLTTLRLHRRLLLNPRYGTVGLVAFPYYAFFELLSPFVEIAGWLLIPSLWAMGLLELRQVVPFFVAATLLSTLVSFLAVLFDSVALNHYRRLGDRLRLLLMATVEPFGYHQVNLYFRTRAFPQFYGRIHIKGGWRPPTRESAPDTGPSPVAARTQPATNGSGA